VKGRSVPAHVLFFTSALGGGGAERHLVRIANHLDRRRFRVSVSVARGGGSYEADLADDVTLHPLPGGRMRSAPLPLRRLIVRERPDVVCSFLDHANCTALLATTGLRQGPPVVVGVQNPLSTSLATVPALLRGSIHAMIRGLYPRAAHVVALTQGVGDELEQMIPAIRGRTSVIPNAGFDARVERAAAVPLPQRTGELPTLVACGRLVPQKAFDVLLRALAILRERVPAKLQILGEGPLRGELGALTEQLGLSDVVSFEGFQENPYAYMRAADAFVLSSAYEGFGNVIVEAMALGTPVVATDCPYGPGEILEGGRFGVLVAPGDARALAGGLERVLNDPRLRIRLAREGTERARAFAAATVANSYGRLFEEVLASSSADGVADA
jgi:glycosyltransferase involved in cell wall biosynthesis